jgi:topoisomerase IA-like protein
MAESIDLEYAENGNIIIHSRKSQAERSEASLYVISARSKNKVQNNQSVDGCKKDDEEISITKTLSNNLLASKSLKENGGPAKQKKKKNGKKKHKKNKKKTRRIKRKILQDPVNRMNRLRICHFT